MTSILIIDDEEDIRLLMQGILEDEGYSTRAASGSEQAYEIIAAQTPDLIIQDIWLQGSPDDGIKILETVKAEHPNIPFLMISGHGTIETAVSAIKLGAYDFIEKPFKSDRLLLMIKRALENADLIKQNIALKESGAKAIYRHAEQLPEALRHVLDKSAKTNSRLMITGAAGTGKSVAAHYVHLKSGRAHMPFISLNCLTPFSEALEADLFGSIQGKSGALESCDGGSLLLDEVFAMPLDVQGKLLAFLQDSTYCKVGSSQKQVANVRIIATSSQNIDEKIKAGAFRKDLYYRLNVVPVVLPSLKQRKHELAELVKQYANLKLSDLALAKLQAYSWPGNFRELYNLLDWVNIMHNTGEIEVIGIEHLPPDFGANKMGNNAQPSDFAAISDRMLGMSLREARESFERYYLLAQVNKFGGNISKTAEFIGMERSALHRKLKSLDVFSDDKQNIAV